MNAHEVNALMVQPEPLTDEQKDALRVLPFLTLLSANGLSKNKFSEANSQFFESLFLSHGAGPLHN